MCNNFFLIWLNLRRSLFIDWFAVELFENHLKCFQTFPQEPTVATLAPVIPKASKRIGKKFRGPGGMFASVSKQKLSTFPLKKVPSDAKPKIFRSHAESSEIGQEYLTRPKRKSLVKALDLVKEWTSDKSSNYFNNTKFSSPGKRTSSSPPVKKLKKGNYLKVNGIERTVRNVATLVGLIYYLFLIILYKLIHDKVSIWSTGRQS